MKTVAQFFLNFLLNATWQIAAIALAAGFGSYLLRSLTRFRHIMWVAALTMSLLLPLFSALFSFRSESLSIVGQQNTTIEPVTFVPVNIASSELPPTAAPANSVFHVSQRIAIGLLAAFLILVGYRSAKLFKAWIKTRAIRRAALKFAPAENLTSIVQQCQKVFGVSKVSFLSSRSLKTPATVGIFDPLVILPEDLLGDSDTDALAAAVGHEIVHVMRRDYLLNLIYEVIFLPLSFHPAAALIKRQITKTRELRCDELVTERLLHPEVYARSLVRLAGWAMPLNGRTQTIIVGMADADILEVRIMSLLGRRKLVGRRNKSLVVTALLLLALPCVAAGSFRFNVNVDKRDDSANPLQNPDRSLTNQRDRKARLIYHTEAEYTEDARSKNIRGTVGLSLTVGTDGLVRDVNVTKSLYPSLDQSAVTAARTWRFEPFIKDGQPTPKQMNVEVYFGPQDKRTREEQEMKERAEREDRELKQRIERETNPAAKAELEQMLRRREEERAKAGYAIAPNGEQYRVIFDEQGQRREREIEAKQKTELAKAAKISMDQAIQIATSKTPGKVLECSLVGEHWEGPGELAKPSLVLYHVIILSGDEANPVTNHVLVNAVDGTIFRAEKEERRRNAAGDSNEYGTAESGKAQYERTERSPIQGGVLNGKASSLPPPEYPMIAKRAGASGQVIVEILIDEGGNVIAAHSVSGHPLLQAAAVTAARQATFAPTRLKGEPVKVAGALVYNFVAQ